MKNNIHVSELLKDCPTGMELDCTMYDNVTLFGVSTDSDYPIKIATKNGFSTRLTKYGQNVAIEDAKCVIFPKGKTTWEGFVPPCKFKDGDVISNLLGTCIFKGEGRIKGTVDYYCGIVNPNYFSVKDKKSNPAKHYGNIVEYRFATEEEKQKLFQAIDDNGYKWDEETKTLEKLIEPKFHKGDWVVQENIGVYKVIEICKSWYEVIDRENNHYSISFDNEYMCHHWTIQDANDGDVVCYKDEISLYKHDIKNCTERGTTFGGFVYHCGYDGKRFITGCLYSLTEQDKMNLHPATKEQRDLLFSKMKEVGYEWNAETKTLVEKLIKPKFKVGDKIRLKENHNHIYTITGIREEENKYGCGVTFVLRFSEQDKWELVPNKFDITTLVPFESRVLVRDIYSQHWKPAIYGDRVYSMFEVIGGNSYCQCIPYEGNEHLRGKTDDCDEYFKIWEK